MDGHELVREISIRTTREGEDRSRPRFLGWGCIVNPACIAAQSIPSKSGLTLYNILLSRTG
jgi:hypothetical protein